MSCRGVWILDPSGDIVASDVQTDAQLVEELRQESRQAFNDETFTREFCPGQEQWIQLFPVRSAHFSGVVAVWDDRQAANDLQLEMESLAHDINNLLAVTQGHLELFKAAYDSAPGPLSEALWMLERAHGLVRRLAEAPHQHSSSLHRDPTPVMETLQHLATFLNGSRYPVQWDVLGPVPPCAVDGSDFVEIFQNLLQNACDAMPSGGPITIYVRPNRTDVVVGIRDSGRGVNADEIDKVFVPYFTTKNAGRGLGLYRTRQLIEQYQGRIQVVSTPGSGANFIVTLPGAPDEANASTRTGKGGSR